MGVAGKKQLKAYPKNLGKKLWDLYQDWGCEERQEGGRHGKS